MDCVNHSGAVAAAYCQHCGKPLCAACMRTAPGGQIFCEPCFTAWQAAQQPPLSSPFVPPPMGVPSPGLAAVLGVIPGVGAMYNGQFLKGLVHVLIFAVLVSASHISGVFGLFVFGWICYQVFEAYHTAKARRDGEPLPDPLGLNDVGKWFVSGTRQYPGPPPYPGSPYPGQPPYAPPAPGTVPPPPGTVPPSSDPSVANPSGTWQAPFQAPYQQGPADQSGWQSTYQGTATQGTATQVPPAQGPGAWPPSAAAPGPIPGPFPGPGAPPPVPPHAYWRRPEPIGAIVLIALGALFLLDRIDVFSGRVFAYAWPLVLIGLGLWMIFRRFGDTRQGGPK